MPIELSAEPATVGDYARLARKTDRFVGETEESRYRKLSFGYFGEVGSLLAALKKVGRDQLETTSKDQANVELGDALWYLVNLSLLCGVTAGPLGAAAAASLREVLGEKPRRTRGHIHWNELHALASLHERRLLAQRESLLRQVGEQAGHLIGHRLEDIQRIKASARQALFGKCLAQITLLCVSFKLRIGAVAGTNLAKIFDRWPAESQPTYVLPPLIGKPWEQFEPRFSVAFEERLVAGRPVVVQQIRGLNVGDPLTDNMLPNDGYRFHDVFHLAYAAHLGWSPVIRALLKLKRKSKPEIDENEDGARAIIIEEGIATWIFNDAKGRQYYRAISRGRLDLEILTQVRHMVQGFAVRDTPLWQWEIAILDGFDVFRELLANKGGIVHVDLVNHALRYERLARARRTL